MTNRAVLREYRRASRGGSFVWHGSQSKECAGCSGALLRSHLLIILLHTFLVASAFFLVVGNQEDTSCASGKQRSACQQRCIPKCFDPAKLKANGEISP